MDNPKCIVGLGEVLWDCFPSGPRFGGAPANFACHAAALGATAHVVSRVGTDVLGRRALAELQQRGVHTTAIQSDPDHPTGTVQVTLDDAGVANYQFGLDDAWDYLAWDSVLAELAGQADAICFGTLGQRNATARDTIEKFLSNSRPQCLRVLDLNLRQQFYSPERIHHSLQMASVLKLNEEELQIVAGQEGISADPTSALPMLADRFDFQAVALTLGQSGALLYHGGELTSHPGVETRVIDTVGAGDSFTATLAVGLLHGMPAEAIVSRACRIAAYVCSQSGATPALPEELKTEWPGA